MEEKIYAWRYLKKKILWNCHFMFLPLSSCFVKTKSSLVIYCFNFFIWSFQNTKTFSFRRCEEIHNCLTYIRIFNNAILPFSPTVQIWSSISKVYLCSMHVHISVTLGETPQAATTHPRIWAHIPGRYWSAKKDDISLWPPDFTCLMKEAVCKQCIGGRRRCSSHCCRERAMNRRGWISAKKTIYYCNLRKKVTRFTQLPTVRNVRTCGEFMQGRWQHGWSKQGHWSLKDKDLQMRLSGIEFCLV